MYEQTNKMCERMDESATVGLICVCSVFSMCETNDNDIISTIKYVLILIHVINIIPHRIQLKENVYNVRNSNE
jgi:hypothetical protein